MVAERGRSVNLDGAGFLHGAQAGFELGFLVQQARGTEAFIGQEVGLVAGEVLGSFVTLQGERRGLLVAEVQFHERLAPRGPLAEVLVKGQPGGIPT